MVMRALDRPIAELLVKDVKTLSWSWIRALSLVSFIELSRLSLSKHSIAKDEDKAVALKAIYWRLPLKERKALLLTLKRKSMLSCHKSVEIFGLEIPRSFSTIPKY